MVKALGTDNVNLKAETFFRTDRSPSFYWLVGLFYGDGCLHAVKNRTDRITMFCGSVEVMKKVQDLVGGRLYTKTNDFAEVKIYSKELFQWWLDNTNLKGGKKSSGLRIPDDLFPDSNAKWHFIRGYFDADGYTTKVDRQLTTMKKGLPKLAAGFGSSSYEMLEDIQNFVLSELDFFNAITESRKKLNGELFTQYTIKFTSGNANLFLTRMYRDKGDAYYTRKYLNFEDHVAFKAQMDAIVCKECGSKIIKDYRKELCYPCFWKEKVAERHAAGKVYKTYKDYPRK